MLWQLRDYATERGLPTLVVAALLIAFVFASRADQAPAQPLAREAALAALDGLLQAFAPIATLLAVNGIISTDRTRHYFRLLFANPISIARYYAQAFLVAWVGTCAAAALLLVAFRMVIAPLAPAGALAFVALYFLLFGGVGFLLSAITRYDWLVLGIVWALAQLLRSLAPAGEGWYARVLDAVLPPLHVLPTIGAALMSGHHASWSMYAWVAGYGAAALLLGLALVRHRPLAS
jgi:hypothetical protein